MPTFSDLAQYNALKSKFKRTWTLCMTLADTAAFSNALKAAFPSIRFVSEEYWRHFIDQDRLKYDLWIGEREWQARIERTPFRFHYVKNLDGESLHYWDSLADPAETNYWVWIEPPGWRPQWGPPDERGERELTNMPTCEFVYHRSGFRIERPTAYYSSSDELLAGHNRETVILSGETFEVRWNRYDEEGAAFGKKVFKILRRLTVDRFVSVERKSRRSLDTKPLRRPSWCLIGKHADAWTRKRRHNYLEGDSGPFMKSAIFRFRPKDVFTAAELAEREARQKAELEERIRKSLEESKQRSIEWRKAHPKKRGVRRSRLRPPTA